MANRFFHIAISGLFVGACVCLLSCGSANPRSGEKGGMAEERRAESNDEPSALMEPGRLDTFEGETLGSEPPSQNPRNACRLNGDLPPAVPKDADADSLHRMGQERILAKNGPEAVLILGAAVKKAPDNANIIGDFATSLLQCRFYDEAIQNARKAAALEPENVDIAANLAQTYQIAGRFDEAIASYRRAIAVDPMDHAAHNNLSVLLILGDLQGAEKEARLATNLAPKNASYLVNLGYILYRQKRLVDAEMILTRALEVDPNSADAHNQLGLILAAQHRNKEAMDQFRLALELRPDHMAAKENLKAMEAEGFNFEGPWDKK